jgi:hypothetical protein
LTAIVLHRVGHVLEGVRGGLELVDDLLELHHRERVVLAAEQPGEQPPVDLVGLVLQPVELDPELAEVLHRAQPRHGLGGQLGGPLEHVDLVGDLGRQLADLVEHDQVDAASMQSITSSSDDASR